MAPNLKTRTDLVRTRHVDGIRKVTATSFRIWLTKLKEKMNTITYMEKTGEKKLWQGETSEKMTAFTTRALYT